MTRRALTAIIVGLIAAAIGGLDLFWSAFSEYMSSHQIVSSLITEAVLLAAIYLVIEEFLDRRAAARSARVATAAVGQLEHGATGVRTMLVLPLFMPPDWHRRRPSAPPTDEEVVERLPAFLEAGAKSALPGGLIGLRDNVREQLQALGTAFATWAPGLVGNAALDSLLNVVPDLMAKGWAVDSGLMRAAGLHGVEDLSAPDPDAHARQAAAEAVRDYLQALREFEDEVNRYRKSVPRSGRRAEPPRSRPASARMG